MKKGIIWSYTKGEFVIFDHYYFSTLYNYINSNYKLEIPTKFNELIKIASQDEYKAIIFNYPEKSFTSRQIEALLELFYKGKTLVFLTYYKNEDRSSEIVNSILTKVGLKINYDEVLQLSNIHNNDKYLIITSQVSDKLKNGLKSVIMPCTSSIDIIEKEGYVYDVLLRNDSGDKVIAAEVGKKGKIIAFGTCVFWDNFSISLYDNFQFTKKLINYCLEV
ncbi:MAG: hypothetical protein RMJ36_00850 [Candidatus Calescibacterium sp.]|nr:hypothetical protein [Candidatus Calescibacterium sp.]MDW8132191.1 hypothetical protein [Candidatus Calescibacterium sp.]